MSNKNHATDANSGNNGQKVQGERRENPKVEFSEYEEDIIAKMFRLVGERWSLIAGRIPGRTAEEIEKYWSTKFGSQRVTRENPKLEFCEYEEDIIAKMFILVGERWSLIAGRIPGRTAEEIEKYWTTKFGLQSEECSSSSDD